MRPLARLLRTLAKWRFRWLGLATIKDIPTARFRRLVDDLVARGWRKVAEYDGFDAWIDYGRIKLRKDGHRLLLEWDNWTEGSIEGRRTVIEGIARDFGLEVVHQWRWSDRDHAFRSDERTRK
jgi:hypothetical protein